MEDKKLYTKSLDELSKEMDLVNGLTEQQVIESREKNGENKLVEPKRRSLAMRFIDQFKDVMIIILLVASCVISGIAGEGADAIIIIAIVVLNAIIGLVQEDKAEKSLKALQDMSTPHAKVIRGGHEQTISSPN
ncbi:cation-transporting P-type ATPase [Erysipelothrix sp. D19-032]